MCSFGKIPVWGALRKYQTAGSCKEWILVFSYSPSKEHMFLILYKGDAQAMTFEKFLELYQLYEKTAIQTPEPAPKQEPTPAPKQEPTPAPKQEPTPAPKQEPTPTPAQPDMASLMTAITNLTAVIAKQATPSPSIPSADVQTIDDVVSKVF